jgi:hypothetical protein
MDAILDPSRKRGIPPREVAESCPPTYLIGQPYQENKTSLPLPSGTPTPSSSCHITKQEL